MQGQIEVTAGERLLVNWRANWPQHWVMSAPIYVRDWGQFITAPHVDTSEIETIGWTYHSILKNVS